MAKNTGYEINALTFDYGSKHEKEIESAKNVSRFLGAKEHLIFPLALSRIGGSALLDDSIDINKGPSEVNVPNTYVPARNTIFLAIALSYAEVIDADAIFIGANSIDYSGYPDCRSEFIEAFDRLSRIGTKKGVEGSPVQIIAPLIDMSKADIIREGKRLGIPYELTWTCYEGGSKACGMCDACKIRLKGFEEAGYEDPAEYEVLHEGQ
jgi:7-cyano-7-deazaguanine synthase